MRVQLLTELNDEAESLLRMRALEHTRDVERSLDQIRAGFQAGKLTGACLYDPLDQARGLAVWRWHDSQQTIVQIVLLYIQPVAPLETADHLVEQVLLTVRQVPSLALIEARLRDTATAVRVAWARQGMAFFERCRMVRMLAQPPLPVLPTPARYHVARWNDAHQVQVERLASLAYASTIDAVVVPDSQPERVVKRLRRLQMSDFPGIDAWNGEASLVVLGKNDEVAGFIALAQAANKAVVADLAVHPAHQHRGLARLLLLRSMNTCLRQGIHSVSLAVTTRNPVRALCNQLGFQATDCGDVGIWWHDGRQHEWEE